MGWYLELNGKQLGPMNLDQAKEHVKTNPNGFVWREGYLEWVPIEDVAELQVKSAVGGPPPRVANRPTNSKNSDEVDYKVFGAEMQFVEIELDPGESVVAEAGAMMYKDSSVEMDTIFGDGSAKSQQGGFMDKLIGVGKRVLTGESLFMTVFTHKGYNKAKAAFGAPYPGNIIPVNLAEMGGTIICQKDSFLCAAKGVSVGSIYKRKFLQAYSVVKDSSCKN